MSRTREPKWSTERGVSERRLLELRDAPLEESTPEVEKDEARALAAELLELRVAAGGIAIGNGKATPGPWLAFREKDTWHVRSVSADVGVASVVPSEPGKVVPTDHADAVLIAAAPELLDALEDLLPWAIGTHEFSLTCSCDRCDKIRAAKRAMAKAVGHWGLVAVAGATP